jgi:hypothetical protein
MHKHDFKQRLSDITKTTEFVIEDFEKKHNLIQGQDYQIRLSDGKTFHGFFIKSRIHSTQFKVGIDIWINFFKSKKNGEKSKIKKGCFITEVIEITPLPF